MSAGNFTQQIPAGCVVVTKQFLRALLHDSECTLPAQARADNVQLMTQLRLGDNEIYPGCPHPDHGMSFTELRDLAATMCE